MIKFLLAALLSSFTLCASLPTESDNLPVEGNFLAHNGFYIDEDGTFTIPQPRAWRCNNCHRHNPYPTKRCYGCNMTREESGS